MTKRLDDVAERLHAGAIRLLRRVRVADAEAGISPSALSAMSVIVFGGPTSLKDLAAAEQVTAPTMSKLVADLETQGLAVKRKDRQDARAVRIEATAKGKRLLEEGRARRLAMLRAELKGFTSDEIAALDRAADLMLRI
ncbi:MAG: winged helix DNA-binding protein [Hyphomonadaceae bacterium]|nr:winged helix DNA-binding protein [Hyphomonadaceae bacterium]